MKYKKILPIALVLSTGFILDMDSVQAKSQKSIDSKVVVASESRWLDQGSWQSKWSGHQWTFTQTLSAVSQKERSQLLTYRLVNQKGEVVLEEPASVTCQPDGQFQAQVTFDLKTLTNETYLYLELAYKGHVQKIKHQQEGATVFNSGKVFQLVTKDEHLMLLNQSRTHWTYQSHTYFAEQLHVQTAEAKQPTSYQLRRVDALDEQGTIGLSKDQGIDLRFLEEGSYFIYFDQQPIHVITPFKEKPITWYTVTRQGRSNQINLSVEGGMLTLNVKSVTQLPKDVYDIVVDPGHGGADPGAVGNGATEAEEVLKVSTYIAKRLEDHGLKVKLTRSNDKDPAAGTTCTYDTCPYVTNGRIEQLYATETKYTISNHLNASESKQARGAEVYSSVKTSDQWSSQVIQAFNSIQRQINDVKNSASRISTGSYKRGIGSNPVDYYYMLRESGGEATQAQLLSKYNQAYQLMPKYGSEVLLIEYAYISNSQDFYYWSQNWETLGELVVKATVQYLGIPYRTPAILTK